MNVKLVLTDKVDRSGLPIFELTEDYLFVIGPGSVVTIPQGFQTNFGSIPRFARWFVSPVQLGEAAIVHDYLCNEDLIPDDDITPFSGYSRWIADCILYEAMSRMRLSSIKKIGVFLAVVSYGILTKRAHYAESLPIHIEKK